MSIHRLPSPALVVLVGASGSGKSRWAVEQFRDGQVLSSDRFRALVGTGPHDQQVSADAFALLDQLLSTRLERGLTTVVDTLGLDREARRAWAARGREHGFHTVVVGFDTPAAICRERNAARPRSVPRKVLDGQLRRWRQAREELAEDGFDRVIVDPGNVRVVPANLAGDGSERQRTDPATLRFDLQIAVFEFADGANLGPVLRDIAAAAEVAGFGRLWLMDHLRQIPQVGPEWWGMLEPYTTLAHLAAATDRIGLGTMVTNVGLRNVGLLAKTVATLDVLSGGRAVCGLGAGWFEAEERAYGYGVPTTRERLDLLDDALQVLPLLWGPGSPPFEGRRISIPEALCYPRPIQERIPILVGGGGERRTLRLAARHADAVNLIADPETLRHKLTVLDGHCSENGRDREEIEVTVLTPLLHAATPDELEARLDQMAGGATSRDGLVARLAAGTTDEQIGRFRDLADAGADTIIVSPAGVRGAEDVAALAPIVAAFG